MNIAREVPWPRILAEGAAIVASILLAFSIQAWWEGRQDEEDERQILISLLEEFRAKKDQVDFRRPYNEAILSSTKKLLYASAEGGHGLSSTSIDQLLADLWWNNNSAEWSVPLLDSVVSGDELGLISNVQLRRDLVTWSGRFGRIRETVSRAVDFYDDRLMWFMESNVAMPQILNSSRHLPGHPEFNYNYGARFSIETTVDHSSLLSSQEFQGILTRRTVLLTDILTESFHNKQKDLSIEQELDEIISVIEAELAN